MILYICMHYVNRSEGLINRYIVEKICKLELKQFSENTTFELFSRAKPKNPYIFLPLSESFNVNSRHQDHELVQQILKGKFRGSLLENTHLSQLQSPSEDSQQKAVKAAGAAISMKLQSCKLEGARAGAWAALAVDT